MSSDHRLLTASALARAAHCPASQVLPWTLGDSAWSLRGTYLHRVLALLLTVGREAALAVPADDEEWKATATGLDPHGALADLVPGYESETTRVEVELAVAVRPEVSARRLPIMDRAYGAGGLDPGEIPGTMDALVVTPEAVAVVDWKTGHGYQPPPADHHQLLHYALAARELTGAPEILVALGMVHDDGAIQWRSATVDAWALDTYAEDLSVVERRVARAGQQLASGRVPDVHAGPWCTHCPALAQCPSTRELLAQVIEPSPLDLEARAQAMVAQDAGRAYEVWKRVAELEDVLGRAVRAQAAATGLELRDGRRLAMSEVERLDPSVAYETISALLGEEAANQACPAVVKREASKASVERTVREFTVVPSGMKAREASRLRRKATEDVMRALREAGAVRVHTQLREVGK